MTSPSKTRHIRLLTDRPVEQFLVRLFLRDANMRSLCIVSPFISSLAACRFTLMDLRRKVERDRICTYVTTREPTENYQAEAMTVLLGSPWIEVRYNPLIHAKVYLATATREADSFGLFGSANLTSASLRTNIEVAMMILAEGNGRSLLNELFYWACVRLRTLGESRLVQRISVQRK